MGDGLRRRLKGSTLVSLDPSSIPSFGGQQPRRPAQQQEGQGGQAQQGGNRRPTAPILPNADLVKQLLDRMNLKHTVDKQGDVVAPWKHFRTYFMFRGEKQQQVLSVRTFYDRPHGIEDKPRLQDAVDTWNHSTLWPKVYTHTSDDGTVRMIGETHMLIGTGVAFDHFVSSVVSWVRASIEFDKWLVERLGLAKDADEDGAAGEGGESGDGPAAGGAGEQA
jgi:hypothetical protein